MDDTKALVNTDTGEIVEYDPNELTYEFLKDPFRGVSEQALTPEQTAILSEPIDIGIIEVRPTGEIYAPHMKYRQLWCKAFSPGGWGLVPMSQPRFNRETNEMLQEWALYVGGRFISSTVTGAKYYPLTRSGTPNPRASYADVLESIKSDAIRRLGKDLGMFPELWDKHFAQAFIAEHCVWVDVLDYSKKVDKWCRLKRAAPFKEETDFIEVQKKSAGKQASKPVVSAKAQAQPASGPQPEAQVMSTPRSESGNGPSAEELAKLQAEKKVTLKSTHVSESVRTIEFQGKHIPADELVGQATMAWFNKHFVGPYTQKGSLEDEGKFHPAHLTRHLKTHFNKAKLPDLTNEEFVALVRYTWQTPAINKEGGGLTAPWYSDKIQEMVGEAPQGDVMAEAQETPHAVTLADLQKTWYGPEGTPVFPGNNPNIETVAERKWGKPLNQLGESELTALYNLAAAVKDGLVKVISVEDAVKELEL